MGTHTEFHFSPRPNRASEIAWNVWGEDAFARARHEDKPILLSISAVWCHWCHVMDETSYSNPSVIETINRRYVPVRVDNDRRPDVNARYNQGGWPTTAFLTPDGVLIAGATYLPPDQLGQALEQIADFYETNRADVEERAAQIRSASRSYELSHRDMLQESMIAPVVERIADAYDSEYGGFGTAPKFPMVDVLEFLLLEYRVTRDQRLYEMLAKTMLAMSGGGMYDHVEGGFFRYSTTQDWSVPHFEKMTEDHAGLLRALATLTRITRNEQFRSTLLSSLAYVRTVLRDPVSGFFGGSQDADEAYYAMPLEERRSYHAPYVDRTSYSNWTAAMAGTFVLAGDALEDERIVNEGLAALDALHERMRDQDGLLFHFVEPGGEPRVRGLLTDQSAYLRALLDAHEFSGEGRFLDRARELGRAIEHRFAAPDGGYYDSAGIEEALGALDKRDRPLNENASIADSLLRLGVLEGDEAYRDRAERVLLLFAKTYERAGLFAAQYARALRRYLHAQVSLVLVGTSAQTDALREAGHALGEALISIRTRPVTEHLAGGAYLCVGTACAAPASDAAGLRDAYETLTAKAGT